MIIARSPLRISIAGGGTDLPSYYSQFGSDFISAAINKYIFVTIHETFINEAIIKYSEMERVSRFKDIKHPIIREALLHLDIKKINIEITSMADIPAGTGLGSSGSFTTSLLTALKTFKREIITPRDLAELATHIEIDRLKEPIGKQDQYISAIGGLTNFHIDQSGNVTYSPLNIDDETLYSLEENLLLFFTGYERSAAGILSIQDQQSKKNDKDMVNNLHFIKELGGEIKKSLEAGDLKNFAHLMNVHWERKKKRSDNISNSRINDLYDIAMKNGALGGKLVGAGGGGFLMFYAQDKLVLRKAMKEQKITEVRFQFDFEGSKIIVNRNY